MYDDYIGPMDTVATDALQGSVLGGIKWSTDSASVLTVSVQSECSEPKEKKERKTTLDWPNDRGKYRNLTVTVVVSVI